ncbi:MAG: MFS transporter [Chloroflexi bacterium]|nr:MAG: MFS transporter [Chloroflexota bacterium]
MPQTTARSSNQYIELVRENPDFRNLWLGQVVSLLGDWFNLIGSAALIATLTDSGVALSGLFVVRMLAPFLVSPIAGVVADRYDRRTILVVSDLMRAGIVLCFLFVRSAEMVWLLYVLTALQLGVSGFFDPAKNAILPDVVPPQRLGAANAVSSATWSVMMAFGAAIGGLVAGTWGVYTSFVLDALTFLLSAFFIWQVRYRAQPVQGRQGKSIRAALGEYLEGLSYLNRERDILMIASQKGLIGLAVAGGFNVVQVAIAEQVFVIGEGGSLSLGIFLMIFGIGTGVGPIVARRWSGDRDGPLRKSIAIFYGLTSVGLLVLAPLADFYSVNLGMFIRGFGGGVVWVFATQLLLQNVPAAVRGRVFATEFAIFALASAIGAAWTGLALDHLGISATLWLMFWFNLVPGGIWLWWTLRRNRAMRTASARHG